MTPTPVQSQHHKAFSWTTIGVIAICAIGTALFLLTNGITHPFQASLIGSATPIEGGAAIDGTLFFLIGTSLLSIFLLGLSFKWLQFYFGNGSISIATGGAHAKKASKELFHPAEVLESLTFLWVFSALLFSLYNIYVLFAHAEGVLHFIAEQATLAATGESAPLTEAHLGILLHLSLFCGLLGGTLANLRFFLKSRYDKNGFQIDYVYQYIANPFISTAAGFLSFLLLVAMPLQNAGMENMPLTSPVSYIFLFCLAGFFSNSFFLLLRTIAKQIEDFVSAPAELAALRQAHEGKRLAETPNEEDLSPRA